jgi:hypothetical protein
MRIKCIRKDDDESATAIVLLLYILPMEEESRRPSPVAVLFYRCCRMIRYDTRTYSKYLSCGLVSLAVRADTVVKISVEPCGTRQGLLRSVRKIEFDVSNDESAMAVSCNNVNGRDLSFLLSGGM